MNKLAFRYQFNPTVKNSILFNGITKPCSTWDQEVLTAVEQVRSSTTKDLVVCYSGGIDSELICWALLQKKISFKVLTVKFKSSLNNYDIDFAIKFCKKYNIDQTFIDIDPIEFYTNGIQKYISKGFKAHNLYRYFQMFLLEQVEKMDCTAIIGSGEQMYAMMDDQPGVEYFGDFFTPLAFNETLSNLHYPCFYYSTPELVLSYMETPPVAMLLSNPAYLRRPFWPPKKEAFSANLVKQMVIYNTFPELELRRKYSGFESFYDFRLQEQRKYKMLFPELTSTFLTIDQMKSQLQS
jgi:hypothetical protein